MLFTHYYVIFNTFFLKRILINYRRIVNELLTSCKWTIEKSCLRGRGYARDVPDLIG